jgi:oligosaccharide repeat unit polymerase
MKTGESKPGPGPNKPQSIDLNLRVKALLNRNLLLNPVVIASVVWLSVFSLYAMHLSKILVYSTEDVIVTSLWIWIPIVIVAVLFYAFRRMALSISLGTSDLWQPDLYRIEKRLKVWFWVWLAAATFETVVSGGVPLLWLFQNTTKNYDSYGVTSVHGIVKSLFISIALCRFTLWVLTEERRHLKMPAFALAWALILIDRSMFLVCVIEYMVVYLRFRKVRMGTFLKIAMGGVLFIFGFGIVGDLRLQGSSSVFRALAQPTDNYPTWLPSGILWAYIYTTTPINNLVHTMHLAAPLQSLLFPNTLALLFPTAIRQLIYGSEWWTPLEGQLVNNAFNAATAYIGPYQDYGYLGVVLFSCVITFVCQKYWFGGSLKDTLKFAVVTQCLILTLFYNHLFALPIIFQVVWFEVFFSRRLRFGVAAHTSRAVAVKHPALATEE